MMSVMVPALSVALLMGWHLLRVRKVERLRGRLVPLGPPPAPLPRPEGPDEVGRSADQLTEAAGLRHLGRIYGPLLARAGVYSPWAASIYTAAKLLSLISLVLAWMWFSDVSTWNARQTAACAGSFVALVLLPDLVLWSLVVDRKRRLQHGLPEWLDLHTTLVEGGMSFDAALARIVEETEGTREPVFREVQMVYREILMGTARTKALRRMADRTQVGEIDQIVTALIHADRLGAGIANALRPQADMIRNRIWEEARTRAERLGTKLLFPIFMGSLPVFFVLLVLPLVLRLAANIRGIVR